MWQAALGDDELLDDENEATDTATWFPEDAQGQANGNAWDVSGANNQQDSTGSFPFDATQSSMDAWKTSNATVHMSPPMTANNFGQGSSVAPSWQQPQAGVEGIGQAHHDSLNSGRHGSLSYRQTPQTVCTPLTCCHVAKTLMLGTVLAFVERPARVPATRTGQVTEFCGQIQRRVCFTLRFACRPHKTEEKGKRATCRSWTLWSVACGPAPKK